MTVLCVAQLPYTNGQLYVLLNGTQYASTDEEEAHLVIEACLKKIISVRVSNQEEEIEVVATAKTFSSISAPIASVPEETHSAPAPPEDVASAVTDAPLPASFSSPTATPAPAPSRPSKKRKKRADTAASTRTAAASSPSFTSTSAPDAGASSSTPAAAPSPTTASSDDVTPEERREVIRKALLMLDGEYYQVKSILDHGLGEMSNGARILLMKLAAACSKTQQASDVMKSFLILHAYFDSEQFHSLDLKQMLLPQYMPYVENLLKDVPSASRETFLRYFAVLPTVLATAYKPNTVTDGYMKSGTNAFLNPRRVLMNCPSIAKNLSTEQLDELVKRMYDVAAEAVEAGHTGTVPDDFLEERLQDLIGPVTERGSTSTTDKVVNQWRATILTDTSVKARLQEKIVEAEHQAEVQDANREAKRAKKDLKDAGVKVVNCSAQILSGCNSFASKAEAETPGQGWVFCRAKGCTKVLCHKCAPAYGPLHASQHEA